MTDTHDQRLRIRIAQEAARILLDEGVEDYHLAKRKAADRLNASHRSQLPRNSEVERAVRDHQRLFFTNGYHDLLSVLRRAALDGMRLLREFEPRLVGSVLQGTAGKHSEINLHVFADAVEEVLFVLMHAGITYRSTERRLRYGNDVRHYPCLRLLANGYRMEIVVLPTGALRQSPLSPVDGKPMQRATIKQVERLLQPQPGDSAPDVKV
ncbi:MAG: hypothetical protein M3294_01200 [Pseudomonadota bacterium]|nr:hypothetical protein [Pseudomonadota bacterium]